MENLLGEPKKIETAELIQQMAMLMWLHKGEEHKDLYKMVTGARVANELYSRLTADNNIDVFRNLCISGIVDYIKAHPKVSEAELTKEVEKHIKIFKDRVDSL